MQKRVGGDKKGAAGGKIGRREFLDASIRNQIRGKEGPKPYGKALHLQGSKKGQNQPKQAKHVWRR